MKHFQILGTLRTAATLLFSVIFVFSCTKQQDANIKVSLKTRVVKATETSQFLFIDCEGDWTVTLDTGDQSGEVDWAWFQIYRGDAEDGVISINREQADGRSVVLYYARNNSPQERKCRIVATCGSSRCECTLTQEAGHIEEKISEVLQNDPTPNMWLELPAMAENDGRYFVTHYMRLGNVNFRNYSFYLSEKDKVSSWVAYALNPWTISSGVSRTNAWGLDPKVPRKHQPVIYSAFGNSKIYARGHQCPSADRYADGANQQTFYGTNMTPQMHALNSYAWASLEGMIRSKCRQVDTLYVVTGCDLKNPLGTTTDNDGKKITIPSGYYKVVLGYKRSKISGASQNGGSGSFSGYYTAGAWYFEHKDYGQNIGNSGLNARFMTVDQLENKLGEDFFPNLVNVLGAEKAALVESQNDTFWKF